MKPSVVVLDFGVGNVRSVCRAVARVGADVTLTADPDAVAHADGLVVPGVGAFGAVMEQLNAVNGPELIRQRIDRGRGVLGICVGLQVMFEASLEKGVHHGLGMWSGRVERLNAPVVPHVGWSPIQTAPGSTLFTGVEEQRFYFVHSFAAKTAPSISDAHMSEGKTPGVCDFRCVATSWATHEERFVAAVEDGALNAVQFHPEKSGDAGAVVLKNWLNALDSLATRV